MAEPNLINLPTHIPQYPEPTWVRGCNTHTVQDSQGLIKYSTPKLKKLRNLTAMHEILQLLPL